MSHETFQCTEEDHCDREDLLNAVNIMSNIAAFINESKRRKDIGKNEKYENDWIMQLKLYIFCYVFFDVMNDSKISFLVDKYREEEDKTLTRRISKLNMHSINKKSTRMSQRIFSSLGMEGKVNI